ncbi:hypothetical protein DH2020_026412 [Rehmannia glutinosa]|uniref:Phosphoribosylformimino-5-aminoimidazole carboxamide ribotide isomerase n=1 Tax=Rehmannia glutinosa TaxID=99300 RepID=A0ABR0VXV4_REHGL
MSIHNFKASSIWKDLTEPSTLYAPRKPTLVHAAPRLELEGYRYNVGFSFALALTYTSLWDGLTCNVHSPHSRDHNHDKVNLRENSREGKVKQIVGSTLRDSKEGDSSLITNYESDKSAAEYAKMYKDDGLTGGHVIMLGADPLSNSAAIEALHAYPDPILLNHTREAILSYSDTAVQNVNHTQSSVEFPLIFDLHGKAYAYILMLNNLLDVNHAGQKNYSSLEAYLFGTSSLQWQYVFNDGQVDFERLKELAHAVGKQRLVLDLSCRKKDGKYAVVTDRWQKFTDVYLDEKVLEFLANYADEFLVHGVDVEGKKLGIDEELVALLGRHSPIPVTYAGGVTTMADLERIKIAGTGRVDVTVGSALDIFLG